MDSKPQVSCPRKWDHSKASLPLLTVSCSAVGDGFGVSAGVIGPSRELWALRRSAEHEKDALSAPPAGVERTGCCHRDGSGRAGVPRLGQRGGSTPVVDAPPGGPHDAGPAA